MGRWQLEDIARDWEEYDARDFYGHQLKLTFRLRYEPTEGGSFSETPKLVWREKIALKDRHRREFWEHEVDQYERTPAARTLLVWRQRYLDAYREAVHAAAVDGASGDDLLDLGRRRVLELEARYSGGSARLLDRAGRVVRASEIAIEGGGPAAEARAARGYLERHGNTLQIEIRDRPSLLKPTPARVVNKERLLRFIIGVEGGSVWIMANQYLAVDGGVEGLWQREFHLAAPLRGPEPSWDAVRTPYWVDAFSTRGLPEAFPPADVMAPGVRIPFAGEYRSHDEEP